MKKSFYKYMLLSDVINGKDICMLICEQGAAEYPDENPPVRYILPEAANLSTTPDTAKPARRKL